MKLFQFSLVLLTPASFVGFWFGVGVSFFFCHRFSSSIMLIIYFSWTKCLLKVVFLNTFFFLFFHVSLLNNCNLKVEADHDSVLYTTY